MKKIIVLMAFLIANASATIINIPADYTYIQAGIDASTDGDTVLVQPGTYVENINFNGHNIVLGSLFLTTGDTSYIERTVIDGDSAGSVVTINHEEDNTTILTGFTITSGYAALGGGIFIAQSNPTIDRNTIENNIADLGGGIGCTNSNAIIINNKIDHNQGVNGGGAGLYLRTSNAHIINNTIISNITYIYIGGGVSIDEHSEPLIEANYISENHAQGGGGIGIFSDSSPEIKENNISNNSACFGGGVYCYYAKANIIANTIAGNSTNDNYSALGAGICAYRSRIKVVGNTIHGNASRGNVMFSGSAGGGFYGDGCETIIKNNLFFGNWVWTGSVGRGIGGGLFLSDDSDYLESNIICGNYSKDDGNGIFCCSHNVRIINCIIRDNTGDTLNSQISGDCALVAYNNIQSGYHGEGNIDVDPLFRYPENGDFHLMAIDCGDPHNSPCIDAGHPDILDSLLDCNWGLGSLRSDMGAYGGGDSVGVSVDDLIKQLPKRIALSQNYPNPFNVSTMIKYELPQQTQVTIEIYDILGRKVSTLIDKQQPAGYHQAIWRADDFASGMYFYKLQAGDYIETKKMLLLK